MILAIILQDVNIDEKITGKTLNISGNPKQEIIAVLKDEYGLVD